MLAAAALVRAAHLYQTLSRPELRDVLLLDSRVYDQMAAQIAAGNLLAGREVFSLGPLYAYFVALVRWLGPDGPGLLYGVQQLLGLASIALVASIARRCGGPRAGIAGAVLIAFYGAMQMFEVKLMSSTLATFLCVASLALLLRAHDRRWTVGAVLPGLLLGAACLARPNTLLFAPFAIGWWVWARHECTPPDASAGRAGAPFFGSFAGSFALCCGIAIAIAPATLRNYWVSGEVTLISSQAGITFFHGNNAEAYGLYALPGGISGNPLSQPADQRRIAEQAVGRPLTQSAISRYWFGRGLAHLTADPASAAGLFARKLRFWLSSDEVPIDYSLPAERELTSALRFAPIPFGLILALAFLGLRSSRRCEPPQLLLYLFTLANLSSVLVFYFASRYRLTAVPMLAALAGCGVVETIALIRCSRCELIAWLFPAILIATLSLHSWTDDLSQSAAHQFFNYGKIYSRQQEPALAIESYRRALSGLGHMAKLHINLAAAYGRLAEHEAAIRHLERALEIRPRATEVRRTLRDERVLLNQQ